MGARRAAMMAALQNARTGRVCVAAALALTLTWPATADAQKLVLLVRHAERADGGAPPAGMTARPDPELSTEGKRRADRLAEMLRDAGVTRIVVTEFRRTKETAQPLARRQGLAVTVVPSADSASAAPRVISSGPDDIVLVVGHSNTLPAILAGLGGPAITIDDADYGNLFVYVPATKAFSRLRY
jgi:broad specificity phosphatase PhoE